MIYWDEKKNIQLKNERNISFEEIADILISGDYLDILEHPARDNQQLFVVSIRDYIWAVPFVITDGDSIFLKTAFPSRKLNKKYGDKNEEKET